MYRKMRKVSWTKKGKMLELETCEGVFRMTVVKMVSA